MQFQYVLTLFGYIIQDLLNTTKESDVSTDDLNDSLIRILIKDAPFFIQGWDLL